MRFSIARFLFRAAWWLVRGRTGAGFVVRKDGKWQPIKL